MAKTVKAVPDGYHTITPSLICREAGKAMDWYSKAFGAEELMRHGGPGGKIMHAEMKLGDSRFMLADEMPEFGCPSPQLLNGSPVHLYVYVNGVDDAWKRATEAGGKVEMPLADMFWGDRCGKLTDPFGHSWTLSQHIEEVSPEQLVERQKAFMAQMA